MSARITIYSLNTLAPILDAIASKDQNLINMIKKHALTSEYGDAFEDQQFQDDILQGMINSENPPETESGYWDCVILMLAELFNLDLEYDYSFNDAWQHYRVWDDYKYLLGENFNQEGLTLLSHFASGRALKGSKVDDSEAVTYSWLLPDEVDKLYRCLSEVTMEDSDYVAFHHTLLESLLIIRDKKSVLLYTAG